MYVARNDEKNPQMSLLFDAVCNRFVHRIMANGIRHSSADGTSYVAYPGLPAAFEFLEARLDPATGDVNVMWGMNQAVMRKDKNGGGYHSFLYNDLREEVTANEHATLDSMMEQACSYAWR
jgi:hypothetical protein